MSLLQQLPLQFAGELHEVRLINFSVEPYEVLPGLHKSFTPLKYKGRALISMVDVQLKNMRLPGWFEHFTFNYRHIGFRLLIDDSRFTWTKPRGIYFLRSFTDQALWAHLGNLFTIYQLEPAHIREEQGRFSLEKGGQQLSYALSDSPAPTSAPTELQEEVARLDRAYTRQLGQVNYVQIQRERWPLQWANCTHFETSFFETAQFEGAFRVTDTIHYQWQPPKSVY